MLLSVSNAIGKLMFIPNGGPSTPADSFISEDGNFYFVSEDGLNYFQQES